MLRANALKEEKSERGGWLVRIPYWRHEGVSAAYLLGEIFGCFSFFLSTWLHWLIRFHVESECLCTVSTFLQRSEGYSSTHTQSRPTLTPPPPPPPPSTRGGNDSLYKLYSLYTILSIYTSVSDNAAVASQYLPLDNAQNFSFKWLYLH